MNGAQLNSPQPETIDTNSDDFQAGALWALAECQRHHDMPEIYSAVAEAGGLTLARAEQVMDEFDLTELRAIFSWVDAYALTEADARRIHDLTDPARVDDGESEI